MQFSLILEFELIFLYSDHNYSDGYFLSGLTDLEIPTLPRGKQLVIYIKNTWGDRNYVGLNGIEVFTDCGKPAEIIEVSDLVVSTCYLSE